MIQYSANQCAIVVFGQSVYYCTHIQLSSVLLQFYTLIQSLSRILQLFFLLISASKHRDLGLTAHLLMDFMSCIF